MVLCVQRLEPRPCHVRIDLGRRDIAVPQQQLNDTQIRAVIEEMGGEGMAQGVWRQGLCDPGTHGVALDEIPERLTVRGLPRRVTNKKSDGALARSTGRDCRR